jgi:hypothetical protein
MMAPRSGRKTMASAAVVMVSVPAEKSREGGGSREWGAGSRSFMFSLGLKGSDQCKEQLSHFF